MHRHHIQLATRLIDRALNAGYTVSITGSTKGVKIRPTNNRERLVKHANAHSFGLLLCFHEHKQKTGYAVLQYINGHLALGLEAPERLSDLIRDTIETYFTDTKPNQHEAKVFHTKTDLLNELDKAARVALERDIPTIH